MYKLIALLGIGAFFFTTDFRYDQTAQYLIGFVAFTAIIIIFLVSNKNNSA